VQIDYSSDLLSGYRLLFSRGKPQSSITKRFDSCFPDLDQRLARCQIHVSVKHDWIDDEETTRWKANVAGKKRGALAPEPR